MALFRPDEFKSVTNLVTHAIVTVQAQRLGDFHIYKSLNDARDNIYAVSPINSELSAGDFKGIMNARRAAKLLQNIDGADWKQPTPDKIFKNPENMRAAFDAIRMLRVN